MWGVHIMLLFFFFVVEKLDSKPREKIEKDKKRLSRVMNYKESYIIRDGFNPNL